MADRKISDLTALTTPASGDYLPIVDISEASAANKNKRITIEELLRGAPDGTAGAPGIAFESDPDTGLYSTGANAVAISTGGTGRLFVDASGNVGVGTSTPATILDVKVASDAKLLVQDGNTTNNVKFNAVNNAVSANVNLEISASNTQFFNGGAERARIDSSGRLLVGTSSNSGGALLQVNDNRIRIATAKTPASASDTGTTGEVCWDANYIYVCTATNTWKRAALSTW